MSIRAARVRDHMRQAFKRSYACRYERVEYRNLFCLGDGVVEFPAEVSVILGGNGVGKSTLTAALAEVLGIEDRETATGDLGRLLGSDLSATLLEKAVKLSRVVTQSGTTREASGDPFEFEATRLDAAYLAYKTRAQVLSDGNFDDVLEPITPRKLGREELDDLSYVVGKEYDHCEVYEVEDYAGVGRFPYFKATSNGVSYGSERMGQGELAIMLILWALWDLPDNSVLILEEPESHVSPRAQLALMNVILQAAVRNGLWTVITTHSPVIASVVPPANIRLLVRDRDKVLVKGDVRRHEVTALLGGENAIRGIALVEDDLAQELAVAILSDHAPDVLRELEFSSVNGESSITKLLQSFPQSKKGFVLLGVYDGDQRTKIDAKAMRWPIAFLPGVSEPAHELLTHFKQFGSSAELGAALQIAPASVAVALDSITGFEPHDWFSEAIKRLVKSKSELTRALLTFWYKSPDATSQIDQFVTDVRQSLNNSC
jgi:predicted ATPase